MANAPLPDRKVPFLDGGSPSVPWYRWFQNQPSPTNTTGLQAEITALQAQLASLATQVAAVKAEADSALALAQEDTVLALIAPTMTNPSGVSVTGSAVAGQNTVWSGPNSITAASVTTPIIDPNSSPGSPGADGVNVLFSGDLSAYTGGVYAFDDESSFTNFTSPYYSFSAFTTFSGTDVSAAKRLFGFNSNPTYSGTATGGSGSLCQALNFTAIFSGTGTLDELNGCAGGATAHSGTVTNGICYSAGLNALGGTFTNGFGYYAFNNINGGTVTQWYSFFDATDEGPSAAGTSHGFYQQATNHPNFWGSTTEFSLATKHDYLTASNIVGTDASKNLTSLAIPLTVANGGTGNATLTAHGVLIGEGTSAVAVTGAGTAGQVLTSNGASADPTFQNAPGGGAMTLISNVTTSGAQTSVTFSSISGSYTHLLLKIKARSAAATGTDAMVMQFNSDTGSHYDQGNWFYAGNSGTGVPGASVSNVSGFVGNFPGSTAPANMPGQSDVNIDGYSETTFFKTWVTMTTDIDGTTAASVTFTPVVGAWHSTAAITSIKVFFNAGSAFVNGSIVSLYGIS